jgi:phospholipid/cholesterol/gamma-HCH transport system substrate-binding protein
MIKRIISALVTVAVVAGGFYAYNETRSELEYYTVSADIEQAPNLFVGGRVMVRGVEVGEIIDVVPRPDGVRVTMQIEEGVKIPADAHLSVVPITVIADRYVQLTPPYSSGALLEDGAHIAAANTSIPAELDDVLKQLKELLATIEPKDGEKRGPLAKLVRDVDYIVRGNTSDLQGTIRNSASFLNNLAGSSEEITGLIRNLDQLFITLAGRRSEIGLVNERFQLVAASLRGDRRDLEGTIENITLLSRETTRLFRRSGDDLGEALKNTDIVVSRLLEQQDEIADGFRWTNVIAQALGATDKSGKGLYAYSGLQAAPGTPGSEYNYRLDTRDTIACERLETLANRFLTLFPGWSAEEVTTAILEFIPEEYHEDIEYLIRKLLPACSVVEYTDGFSGSSSDTSLSHRSRKAIRKALAEVGEERFREAVGVWLLQTIADGEPVEPERSVKAGRDGS